MEVENILQGWLMQGPDNIIKTYVLPSFPLYPCSEYVTFALRLALLMDARCLQQSLVSH